MTDALPLAHDVLGPVDGAPVVLLHGFPQTRRIWRHVAPRLAAAGHRVVVPDLRGYGDSPKPESPDGRLYAKRVLAGDVVALMASLGAERFAVVGHDRGARVAYRLALDAPERVTRVALLDIVPTIEQWESMSGLGAVAMYHWALLAQPFPFPERLLGADPAAIVERSLSGWSGAEGVFDADDLAAHVAAFGPAAIHGLQTTAPAPRSTSSTTRPIAPPAAASRPAPRSCSGARASTTPPRRGHVAPLGRRRPRRDPRSRPLPAGGGAGGGAEHLAPFLHGGA